MELLSTSWLFTKPALHYNIFIHSPLWGSCTHHIFSIISTSPTKKWKISFNNLYIFRNLYSLSKKKIKILWIIECATLYMNIIYLDYLFNKSIFIIHLWYIYLCYLVWYSFKCMFSCWSLKKVHPKKLNNHYSACQRRANKEQSVQRGVTGNLTTACTLFYNSQTAALLSYIYCLQHEQPDGLCTLTFTLTFSQKKCIKVKTFRIMFPFQWQTEILDEFIDEGCSIIHVIY